MYDSLLTVVYLPKSLRMQETTYSSLYITVYANPPLFHPSGYMSLPKVYYHISLPICLVGFTNMFLFDLDLLLIYTFMLNLSMLA